MHESLVRAIKDLARDIEAGIFQSEAAISLGIVKRILHELGWPDFDTQVVAPEFPIGSMRADYALCQPPGQPAVLVEVKDIGKADGKGEKQLFGYCFHHGVPIAVLTDGRQWSLFFPAGLGSYTERRLAQVDLVKDEPSRVAETLMRYLNMADVGSGAARKRAESDYEWGREQRKAVAKYPSVWRKLVGEPDPVLLDRFSAGVEKASGVKPDLGSAAAFIRRQAGVVGGAPPPPVRPVPPGPSTGQSKSELSPELVQPTLLPKSVPLVGPPPTKDSPSFTLQGGQTRSFKTGAKLLGAVFREFASRDHDFCRRYSEQFFGKTRQYVAESRDLLYPGQPKLQEKAVVSLPGKWLLGTNMGNDTKLKRIKEACEVAGFEFGKDIIVHMPVGSGSKAKPK